MCQEVDVEEVGRDMMLLAEESDDSEPIIDRHDSRHVFCQELIVTFRTDENTRFTHGYRSSLSEA